MKPQHATTNAHDSARDIASAPQPIRRALKVWRYRELLVNMVRKELKVKYKNSSLGFFWSLLNPALYLVVFYVVFELVLKSGIENFVIFLLCGLLPWNLFSVAMLSGTSSVVANGPLVKKVYFPREILPLANVGAAIVHFLLQAIVLIFALVIFQFAPSPEYCLLVIPALLALVLFVSALVIALAAANVYLRDTGHFVELGVLAWFWLTPIVYPYELVAERLGEWAWVYRLNPMTDIVICFQRAIYNKTYGSDGKLILPDASVGWYMMNLVYVIVASLALLTFALWLFGRLEGNFAEEI